MRRYGILNTEPMEKCQLMMYEIKPDNKQAKCLLSKIRHNFDYVSKQINKLYEEAGNGQRKDIRMV